MLSHYPRDLSIARSRILSGEEALAAEELEVTLRSPKDRLLRYLELGMLNYLNGDFGGSIDKWLKAERLIEEFDRRPVISFREVGEQLGSIALNDYLITYQGMTYERVLLHIYLALAYLMTSNQEGARVELKKAEQTQKEGLDRLRNRRKRLLGEPDYALAIESKILSVYDTSFAVSMKHKDGVDDLNPLAYYLSGWLYEIEGYPDEAIIDFKRVLELGVEEDFIAEKIKNKNPHQIIDTLRGDRRNIQGAGEGDLFVVYHQDIIPGLVEYSIPVLLRDSVVMIAIPMYIESPLPQMELTVRLGELEIKTHEICDLYLLAKKDLRERAFKIALRQAARLAFKGSLSHEIYKKGGGLASMFSSLYNIFSERADLRSWLTIPHIIQVGRMRVPSGMHSLGLYFEENGIYRQVEIEIEPGEYKILDVHKIGSRVIIHSS